MINKTWYNGFMKRWWLPLLLSEEPIFERDRRPDNPPFSDRFIRVLGENGAKVTVAIYAVLLLCVLLPAEHFRRQHTAALDLERTMKLSAESKTLAGRARESADRHDYGAALTLALAAVRPPIVPEAVAALYNAALNLRERVVFSSPDKTEVYGAVFTLDERFVITLDNEPVLRVWETGQLLQEFECEGCSISQSTLSPEENRLVIWKSSKPILRVYEIGPGGLSKPQLLDTHLDQITYAESDKSARWIVSTSRDGTVQLWDAVRLEPVRAYRGHGDEFVYASFAPDGNIVSLSKGGVIRYFDRQKPTPTKTVRTGCEPELLPFPIIRSDDSRSTLLIHCKKKIILFSTVDGTSRVILHDPHFCCPAFVTTDLAIGGYDGKISVYDIKGIPALMRQLVGHRQDITSIAPNPRGYFHFVSKDTWAIAPNPHGYFDFVSASKDSTAIVWSTISDRPFVILAGHTDGLRSVAVGPKSDLILTGSLDGTARLWSPDPVSVIWANAPTNFEVRPIEPPLLVRAGVSLRVASSGDGVVRVLGPDDQAIANLGRHEGLVVTNILSPTGRYLAIGTDDNIVEIWSVGDWKKMATLDFSDFLKDLTRVTISPDGKSFVASFLFADQTVSWPILESDEELVAYAKSIIPVGTKSKVDAH